LWEAVHMNQSPFKYGDRSKNEESRCPYGG
jgi:hypothetical protein